MSAYDIGADTATVEVKSRTNAANTNAPATIVKWIPGEAITFYAAILGVGSAQGVLTGQESPQELLERIQAGSFGWFACGAFAAVALVIVGAFAEREPNKKLSMLGLAVRIVLTVAAFMLWTSALPGSWSYNLPAVHDMGAAYALLLVPGGIVSAAAAESLTRKVNL